MVGRKNSNIHAVLINPFICENGRQKEFRYLCCPLLKSQKTNASCHQFTRSFAVCKRGRREQINVLTSYIDASNVYGSSKDEADRLRSKGDGKIHLLQQ